MIKPLEVDTEARIELREAGDWYDAHQPGVGAELLEAASEALDRVQRDPNAYRPVVGVSADLPVRQVSMRRFPYRVVYLELPNAGRSSRPGG